MLLWLSYIVMLSLYAEAFGSYAASLLPQASRGLWKHLFLTVAVVLITALIVAGATTVARAERIGVGIKVAILLFFVAVGFAGVSVSRLAPHQWSSPVSLVCPSSVATCCEPLFHMGSVSADHPSHRLVSP